MPYNCNNAVPKYQIFTPPQKPQCFFYKRIMSALRHFSFSNFLPYFHLFLLVKIPQIDVVLPLSHAFNLKI